ncbi:MAG: hypothetical protein NC833_06540 [Candidatus Omnitrophica bacterium]|nr:hypothetical protein [Candidatus Omnitrophota bacterium]
MKDLRFIEPFYFLDYNFFSKFSDIKVSKDGEGIILKNWSSIYLVDKVLGLKKLEMR